VFVGACVCVMMDAPELLFHLKDKDKLGSSSLCLTARLVTGAWLWRPSHCLQAALDSPARRLGADSWRVRWRRM
jgi:hypothetical protein